MKIEKYKKLIHQRIIQTIDEWSTQEAVMEQDIHRVFHNLKGTSGTIGLMEIEKFSEAKERLFSEKSIKAFRREDWSEHLLPLSDMFPHASLQAEWSEAESKGPMHIQSLDENLHNQKRVLVIDDDMEFVTYVKRFWRKTAIR
ncbi:Hpt domain-containing protein [Paenibacillus sp. LHD-38]|uniref:Hpt domain-containing protein n=1 Tax=Paenibacillus sp. LHD-38 TaxID=3072143 RepID=UPI00281023D6|nr:Hpt domain-containing protein [Paenibacillus sp. LHD-38]MDQ8733614.1 Hpt domain-containing protein [Paenibacillus sp. LHD-38]